MRIAIAHSFYRIAGGEDGYVRQQFRLLGREHAVEMIERRNESLAPSAATAVAMTYSPAAVREVEARITAFTPDVIHLHNPYPAWGPAVHLAAAKRAIPVVQTIHNLRLRCPNGLMFTEGAPCNRCERGNHANAVLHDCFPTRRQASGYAAALWLHRFVLRLESRVAAFIAPSRFIAGRLRSWGIEDDRIRIVRNLVALAPPSPPVGDHGVYLGRLSAEKGLADLLHALAAAEDPPFVIAGDGPLRDDLERLRERLRLRRTRFLGRIEPREVSDVLAGCRFLVMPSRCDENAPLAVLEALAAGRAVLVSEVGGLPELVTEGTGLSFRSADVTGLADRLTTLFADTTLCQELGNRARAFAAAEFNPENHVRELTDVYRAVAR